MDKKSPKKKVHRKSAKVKRHNSHPEQTDKEEKGTVNTEHAGDGDGGGNDKKLNRAPSSISLSCTSGRKITDQERKEIREAFTALDEDGDGKLGLDEMKSLLQSQFMSHTDGQAKEVIAQLDKDGSGGIEFEEFENYVIENKLCKPEMQEFCAEMREAFQMFDSDNNGYIDANEFKALMGSTGDMMSEEEIQEMMKDADTNGDGKIDYQEFCAHMASAM